MALMAISSLRATAASAAFFDHSSSTGPQHLTQSDRRRRAQRLATQLEHLGYEVTLREAA